MAYGESNGHMTDEVTWPRRVKSWPKYAWSPISRKQLEMLFSNSRFAKVCSVAVRSAILHVPTACL